MFDILSNLTKATINTALTPVDMAADLFTGNFIEDETYTEERLKRINRQLSQALSELNDMLE